MARTSDTPDKLQVALSELMWENSYGSVTIDEICDRAGVKKGSFYYFYKSKSELAVDSLEYLWEICSRPWMDTAFSPSELPTTRLRNWLQQGLEKTLETLKEKGKILGCPFFNLGSELSSLEPELVAMVMVILDRYKNYITTALRDGVSMGLFSIDDVEATAGDVLTFVQGSITQARITNNPDPLRRLPVNVGRLIGADLLTLKN